MGIPSASYWKVHFKTLMALSELTFVALVSFLLAYGTSNPNLKCREISGRPTSVW
jgi:uncharacterized protein YpmS